MSTPDDIREQLHRALSGGAAHLEIMSALDGVPREARGRRAPGLPHTLWQILEHLRLAQSDILDFGRSPNYEAPEFPGDYWPKSEGPADDTAWESSIRQFRSDLEALQEIVANPEIDLAEPIPHLDGVSWFREILLVVSHNAYHIGQFVQTRRALGCWKED